MGLGAIEGQSMDTSKWERRVLESINKKAESELGSNPAAPFGCIYLDFAIHEIRLP